MEPDPTTPNGPQEEGDEIAPIRPPLSSATERIQVIVEAAERAAAGVIEDAEVQARRYLEESRRRADEISHERAGELAEITESLVGQAHELKRRSDELIAALDRAKARIEERMAGGPGAGASAPGIPEPSAPEVPRQAHLKPVEEPAGPDPAPPPAGARLLATQMAVAGSSRGEIEARLRAEFGIEDPGPMLDSILGPGR